MFEWQHAHTQHTLTLSFFRPLLPPVRNAHAIFIQWHREFAYHNAVVAVMIYLFFVVFCLRYIALFLRFVMFRARSHLSLHLIQFPAASTFIYMRTPNIFAFIFAQLHQIRCEKALLACLCHRIASEMFKCKRIAESAEKCGCCCCCNSL